MTLAQFLSKRSELAAISAFMLFQLSDKTGPWVWLAMCGIIALTALYMLLDGIRRK